MNIEMYHGVCHYIHYDNKNVYGSRQLFAEGCRGGRRVPSAAMSQRLVLTCGDKRVAPGLPSGCMKELLHQEFFRLRTEFMCELQGSRNCKKASYEELLAFKHVMIIELNYNEELPVYRMNRHEEDGNGEEQTLHTCGAFEIVEEC